MNKILTLVALLIGIGSLNTSQAQSDPAAKQILDGVSAKFKSFKAVQSGFTLKVEDGKGKLQGEKSGVVFMKGGKYRVNISGQEIYSDGTNVWTYDKGANEVTITKMEAGQNSLTPQKLFTNFYDKDFLYKLNGEKKVGNRQMQEIELTPIDKSKAFHKVYLLVDKAQKSIHSAKILEKNGNVYTYTVSNFNGKAVIPDAQFIFDKKKYPGVEEIDLR
ncbi:MAG: outer membrane lipoprotein carrier protein LolA [Flavipsychrobacter sp.]|jgi:outer membrane lipoprotein-sorting protein|nr:outer membrane lipoprotein carrier protein LolA [Flavipsychrobacter sp.]